ncbi:MULTISPECIES: tetracycline resistance transcriptional repressor TetR [Pseudomonadota]|uniref:Tetracycline resistance transcriptional repressor TetR n=1 Tax=Bombella apis TaxID=1785988 RepID=A0ABR9MNR6_9PROT|nr:MULTISPECIES: tetracycline resistance transcriptional repressor TetR [Pseudomonadota]AAD25537.1 tetracycline resistance repressor [Pseudomonas sp.]MBE1723500.1 tetracycline resistance transcriptional repressor TetR [Bombella apis]MBR9730281.1 tetracycline resistance transcriptional repressor TetR [Bombella apis]
MTKLDKGTVIAAALELLNEVGMDSLTTRKLAERLRVQQPALYWHFPSKRALLDALAEAMLTERHTRSLPEENEDWRVFLKENALSFRKALLSYRDGARIHAGTRPTEPHYGTAEAQIRFLCTAGFSPKRAVWALWAVSHYVVGSVLEQQASNANDRMSDKSDVSEQAPSSFLHDLFHELETDGMDAPFNFGLDSLIAGFEQLRLSTTD